MTPKLLIAAALLLAATLLLAPGAYAENDQTVVIGAGLGAFGYARSDDLRRTRPTGGGTLSEFNQESQGQLYVEWYALEEIGFGLRLHRSGGFQGAGFSGEREVIADTLLVTAHWVPLGADAYARMGVLAGLGTTSYDVTIDLDGDVGGATSGTAKPLGAYGGWGGGGVFPWRPAAFLHEGAPATLVVPTRAPAPPAPPVAVTEPATTPPSGVPGVPAWSPRQWVEPTLPPWQRPPHPLAQQFATACTAALPQRARHASRPPPASGIATAPRNPVRRRCSRAALESGDGAAGSRLDPARSRGRAGTSRGCRSRPPAAAASRRRARQARA